MRIAIILTFILCFGSCCEAQDSVIIAAKGITDSVVYTQQENENDGAKSIQTEKLSEVELLELRRITKHGMIVVIFLYAVIITLIGESNDFEGLNDSEKDIGDDMKAVTIAFVLSTFLIIPDVIIMIFFSWTIIFWFIAALIFGFNVGRGLYRSFGPDARLVWLVMLSFFLVIGSLSVTLFGITGLSGVKNIGTTYYCP